MRHPIRNWLAGAASVLLWATASDAQNGPFSAEQLASLQQGVRDIYNMEYGRATERFQAMIREAPDDPTGYAFLARTYFVKELAQKQELSIDRFASSDFFEEQPKYMPKLDPAAEKQFRTVNDEAIAKAKARLVRRPTDQAGLFLRGLAYQNLSSFETSLRRGWTKALFAGKKAAADHKKLSQVNPALIDARLSGGAKDYVLGRLPLGWKIVFGLVGYTGNKDQGIRTLEEVARNASLLADDARIVLILIYTREKNYQQAYDHLNELKQKYQRNYLVQLDMAGMQMLMGQPANAIGIYGEVKRRRTSGEPGYADLELAFLYNRLGVAFREAKNFEEAVGNFHLALNEPGVSGRSATVAHLELGKTLDLMGKRDEALKNYAAVAAAEDVAGSQLEARKLLTTSFR